MATTTTNKMTVQLNTATGALMKDREAGQREMTDEELATYLTALDEVVAEARAIRELYKRRIANLASQKSRQARKERVARALALLEAEESRLGGD